jgi:cell division protein FtsB
MGSFPRESPRGAVLGGISSLLFWLCLFAAAALYAGVALSPKLIAHAALRETSDANQRRLVSLERHVEQLRRVIAAQKDDPAFLREQARSDFDITKPGEQRIPVEPHLTLQIGAGLDTAAPQAAPPAYMPIAQIIAGSRSIADCLLAAAAVLVVGAFTLLPARRSSELPAGGNDDRSFHEL